jgi:hypothetical protein
MIDIRQLADTHKADLIKIKSSLDVDILRGAVTSSRKFYDPRIIRYKEVMQRIPDRSYEKPSEEVVIN